MSLKTVSETSHVRGTNTGNDFIAIPAVASQRIGVHKMIVVVAGATSIQFTDHVSTSLSQLFPLLANGTIVLDTQVNGDPWWSTAIGAAFSIVQTAGASISYDIWFVQGP
jgi:hypothetical protein